MATDLTSLSIRGAAAGLRAKSFSAVELAEAHFDAIAKRDRVLHAFLALNQKSAIEHAREVDQALADGEQLSPLAGVPLAVKDTIVVSGLASTAGSKILQGYEPSYEATAVARLRAAGVTILGKTNLDEFAMGSSTEYSAYGPTMNPRDTTRVPGGSSGGSAAAVAAHEAVAALGSDTGGSVRQPAAFCGIVGLKPTYGRVSRSGLMALMSSTDVIGTLTRSVEDAALVLQAMAGRDRRDATTADVPVPSFERWPADLHGLRIGLPREYFAASGMDPRVGESVRLATGQLEQAGACVEEVSLPHTRYALAAYYLINPAEASSNLARYDGIRYGDSLMRENSAAALADVYAKTRDRSLGPEPKRRIMLGTYALSAGYADRYYKQAQAVRQLIRQDFTEAFTHVDLLVTPVSPSLPFRLGEVQDPLTMYLTDIFLVAISLAGLPALSLPVGRIQDLPVGIQLIAPAFEEERLLGAGQILEQHTASSA